jgi:hypothetical protein
MTRLLTLEEVAALLRKTPNGLRWQLHANPEKMPKSALIGGRRMFREADVEAHIAAAFEAEAA